MNFKAKQTFDSKTCEGVRFTVRMLNVIQRAKRDMEIAEERIQFGALVQHVRAASESDALQKESAALIKHLSDKLGEKHDDTTEAARILTAYQQISEPAESRSADYRAGLILDMTMKPAAIQAGLVSIEGLHDDEAVIKTAEDLIDRGPSELIHEIWLRCEELAGMSPGDQKNSLSPGTSARQEDGQTSSTIATTAERENSMSGETVESTSQAA